MDMVIGNIISAPPFCTAVFASMCKFFSQIAYLAVYYKHPHLLYSVQCTVHIYLDRPLKSLTMRSIDIALLTD